jgi:hypothetical protein
MYILFLWRDASYVVGKRISKWIGIQFYHRRSGVGIFKHIIMCPARRWIRIPSRRGPLNLLIRRVIVTIIGEGSTILAIGVQVVFIGPDGRRQVTESRR